MQSWSAEMHNFISHLIGQFDLRHQFWEFVLLLSFFNYNNQIILEQQDTKISVTMINRPIKMVLPFFFFYNYYFHCNKENSIHYKVPKDTEHRIVSLSIQSFRRLQPYVNPSLSPQAPYLPPLSFWASYSDTRKSKVGLRIKYFCSGIQIKKALRICAVSKLNPFPAYTVELLLQFPSLELLTLPCTPISCSSALSGSC